MNTIRIGAADEGWEPLRLRREAWMDGGLCAQTDPELFFPEKGGSTREAKQLCNGCGVQAECLAYALEHDEDHGIWGGMAAVERRKIRRAKRRQQPQPEPTPPVRRLNYCVICGAELAPPASRMYCPTCKERQGRKHFWHLPYAAYENKKGVAS